MTLRHSPRWNGSRFPCCLVAAGAAAVGCALVVPSRAGSAPSVAGCDARSMVVWLEGRGDAGAGSVWYTFGLTNLSGRRCSLHGYPGVSAVNLARRQLGSPAGRNPRSPVRTVLVAPGGSAQFLLQLNDPGFFPRAACPPTTAAGLRVYLPNATTATVVPVPFRACSRTGEVFLHATAVTG